jgi:hypothetical protein
MMAKSTEEPKVTRIEVNDMLDCIELVFDGYPPRKHPPYGNFLGLFGIPPRGGRMWVAENTDYGYCETEEEAIAEIVAAWHR